MAMASDRIPHEFPKFDNVEDERRHRKQRLAAAFRLFGRFGGACSAAAGVGVAVARLAADPLSLRRNRALTLYRPVQ